MKYNEQYPGEFYDNAKITKYVKEMLEDDPLLSQQEAEEIARETMADIARFNIDCR